MKPWLIFAVKAVVWLVLVLLGAIGAGWVYYEVELVRVSLDTLFYPLSKIEFFADNQRYAGVAWLSGMFGAGVSTLFVWVTEKIKS